MLQSYFSILAVGLVELFFLLPRCWLIDSCLSTLCNSLCSEPVSVAIAMCFELLTHSLRLKHIRLKKTTQHELKRREGKGVTWETPGGGLHSWLLCVRVVCYCSMYLSLWHKHLAIHTRQLADPKPPANRRSAPDGRVKANGHSGCVSDPTPQCSTEKPSLHPQALLRSWHVQ